VLRRLPTYRRRTRQPFATIQSDRAATVAENLVPDTQTALQLLRASKEAQQSGQIEEAARLEKEAVKILEAAVTGAENFLDPLDEFDRFHEQADAGSYQLVLKGSRHAGFSALSTLAHAVDLNGAVKADHPDKKMYQNWEKQRAASVATWTAVNRHAAAFFSKHLKGVPSPLPRHGKMEETII